MDKKDVNREGDHVMGGKKENRRNLGGRPRITRRAS